MRQQLILAVLLITVVIGGVVLFGVRYRSFAIHDGMKYEDVTFVLGKQVPGMRPVTSDGSWVGLWYDKKKDEFVEVRFDKDNTVPGIGTPKVKVSPAGSGSGSAHDCRPARDGRQLSRAKNGSGGRKPFRLPRPFFSLCAMNVLSRGAIEIPCLPAANHGLMTSLPRSVYAYVFRTMAPRARGYAKRGFWLSVRQGRREDAVATWRNRWTRRCFSASLASGNSA